MNEFNGNFSELNIENLQSINGGGYKKFFGKAFGYYEVAKEVYDCVSDFGNGFLKGMSDPE